jgi:osmotically-inducible protein OsmY
MYPDQELAGRIRRALLLDNRVSSQAVDVTVTDGIVSLRGAVPTYRRKRIAAEVAASLDGVRGVENLLEVVPAEPNADEQVAENVRRALEAHADVTKESIGVSVKDGVVTLSGNVGSEWERALAEDVALSVRGVRKTLNMLLVDSLEQRDDAHISREIQTAVNLTRGLAAADVRVAVANGTAVLSGRVGQLWQKETAESVARRFGLRSVRNDVEVDGEPL